MDPVCSEEKRKSYVQENNRSPWSSESTNSSTSPLPMASGLSGAYNSHNPEGSSSGRVHLEHSFGSGGSTCSLGSSPGAGLNASLAVPEYNHYCPMLPTTNVNRCCQGGGCSKGERSPSPFNLKARVRRRRQKRLEKQANMNTTSTDDHSKIDVSSNVNLTIFGG